MTTEAINEHQDTVPEHIEPPFEYHLLTGHQRTDGSWKSTEQLQTEYVRLTDELVRQATEGVITHDGDAGEKETRPVDFFVWLDKSARPVQWLTHDLWPYLAENADGNVPPEPKHKFVNIDRNQWTSTIDQDGTGVVDIASIDPSIIRSLRSIFLVNPNDRRSGLTSRIDDAPTIFDGKTVLVVDEVMSTGRTLQYATGFFKRAFPEAHIAGAHWMRGITVRRDGAVGNADIPVWYSDSTDKGRGVAGRNIDLSLTRGKESEGGGYISAQRLGAWFLSVGMGEPDPLSSRLREEIKHLGEDARAGNVFIEPSLGRDEADYDERALRLNHLDTFADYVALKKEHDRR